MYGKNGIYHGVARTSGVFIGTHVHGNTLNPNVGDLLEVFSEVLRRNV